MSVKVSDPVLYRQRPGSVRMGQQDIAGLVVHINNDGTVDLVTFAIDAEQQFQRRVQAADVPETAGGHTYYRHALDAADLREMISRLSNSVENLRLANEKLLAENADIKQRLQALSENSDRALGLAEEHERLRQARRGKETTAG